MIAELYINRCACGWQFLALNQYVKKCPQCRDEEKHCLSCGEKVKSKHLYCSYCRENKIAFCEMCGNEKEVASHKFCNSCQILAKRTHNKYWKQKWTERKNFKDSEINICNYDCFNCKFSDCILPAEKDEQGELF